ncbi:uncharacterized protein LOC110980401 [Acanthaster planci]|uniref:Uncharacterized protein LOC110980401 n=1 Tax=Acanthaster planci TaxID=133434 RepID=A0A8B7YJY1_ACAPL|nr:uncharacterized protein LOC110980401 [Acanthaster planci]
MNSSSEYRPLLNQDPDRHINSRAYTSDSSQSIMLENPVSCSGAGESVTSPLGRKRWPWVIWLLLKIIGLYNYRRAVTRRPCYDCRLAALQSRQRQQISGETGGCGPYPGAAVSRDEDDEKEQVLVCLVDGNMNTVAEQDSPGTLAGDACQVCRSEWWDDRGRYRPYTETDIGVRKWNHRGSAVLSFIFPSVLICLILYDFFFYLRDYWGQKQQLIRLISYSTFLTFNMTSPFLSVVANVRNVMMDHRWMTRRRGFSWYECLGLRYIVKRLQHMGLEAGMAYKPYLAVCVIWPALNGGLRIAIYYLFVVHKSMDVHIQISLATGFVCMLAWGGFCYLMLLMRLSFQKQQRLELAFLWRHKGQVDVCRGRLRLYAEDLGSMCRLVSGWVIVVVAVSTWAFTTQICWDYLVISTGLKFKNADLELQINLLIWSENIMFLVLPLVAVGGFDINKLWVQFVRSVSQMRSEALEDFWDRVLVFCEEQSPTYRVETLTLVFSALGLFLGLHFGDQNVDYWMRGKHNSTLINPVTGNLVPPK